jgi:phage tail sheath protein FI
MPFQLSPGVAVVEKDFSSIVPAVSSSAGAFAGPFAWGPIEDPVRVSSETDLVSRFGAPKEENFSSFFTAANFLAYTNNLLVSRTDSPLVKNAVSVRSGSVAQANITLTSAGSGYTTTTTITVTFGAPQMSGGVRALGTATYTDDGVTGSRTITGVTVTEVGSGYTSAPAITFSAPAVGNTATASLAGVSIGGTKIKNVSSYLSGYSSSSTSGIYGEFAAKFAGAKANGLRVIVLDAGNWAGASATLKAAFTGAPSTSAYAASNGVTNDEVHIAIYDNNLGQFSGTAGSLLEKYSFVSKLSDAKKSDGSNNYYKNVLNAQSKYVWWLAHASAYASEPTSNVVTATAVATFAIAKTITITDATQFTTLAAYKAFFDTAVDKASRQISVTGTSANNTIFTLTAIAATVTNNAITGYTLTVAETPVAETAASTTIGSVVKAAWGQTAISTVNVAGANTLSVLKATVDISLVGGVDDFASTDANVQTAYAAFVNSDQYDISLIPAGNVSAATAKYILDNVVEVRKDCVLFVSPRDVVTGEPIISTGATAQAALVAYRDATNINSSYAVMDSGFKYQYDRYNDAYRWVPLNGDIAGLCARTDYSADPWFSPGGFNRGQIKNIVKLAFNPSQTDRDVLYAVGINPVVTFPGQGTILYGDKTMLTRPSAFDRINVRRLFIVLEKSIAVAAKYQMFEFNDGFTRAQFKNLVEPFLRDVKGRRGVTDFRVKCDEANNTGEVIDRNEFVADIFIKPNRSINYITLNFIAARSSVSFEEIGA